MKVLLPIDGSPCVKNTLEWASHFLNPASTTLYLLNVIYYTPEVPTTDYEYEQAKTLLEDSRTMLQSQGFTVADAKYIVDIPAKAICAYADEVGVDQIIIGSHGRKGLAEFIMGSVSHDVFRHAKQPVIVVKNAANESIEISHAEKLTLSQQS